MTLLNAGMVELVDAPDSKSGARDGVRVRFSLPAPLIFQDFLRRYRFKFRLKSTPWDSSSDGYTGYRAKIRLAGFPPQTASFERLSDAKRWIIQTATLSLIVYF